MQAICIGGASVDRAYNLRGAVAYGTSNPADRASPVFGGVARNVAENLARLDINVALATVIGSDETGAQMLAALRSAGVNVESVKRNAANTDEYAAILERGNLVAGAADMRAAESFSIGDLDGIWEKVASSQWLFLDRNVSREILQTCVDRKSIAGCQLAVDAVSAAKARKLPERLDPIDLLFLNEREARAYLHDESNDPQRLVAALLRRGAIAILLSCGERGTVFGQEVSIVELPATAAKLVSVTGAGDAAIAGTLYGCIREKSLLEAAKLGAALAALTLECEEPVRPDLSAALLESQLAAVAR